jgi:hypothetical protein
MRFTSCVVMLGLACASLGAWATEESSAAATPLTAALTETAVDSLGALADRFAAERDAVLPLAPPDPDLAFRTDGGQVVYTPKEFPADFNWGLVGRWELGVPVYDVTLVPDPETGAILCFNADGKAFFEFDSGLTWDTTAFWEAYFPALLAGGTDADYIQWVRTRMATTWPMSAKS